MEAVDTEGARVRLHEGKAKVVYDVGRPDAVLMEFKDEATAFNAQKRGLIGGKGPVNRDVSALLFGFFEGRGVATHYLESVGEREMLVRRLRMIPVEVVVRNVAAGSLAQRLGLDEGRPLARPVVEFYLKDDSLGDPMVNEYHLDALGIAEPRVSRELASLGLRVNELLRPLLRRVDLELIDFKLEFGLDGEGRVVLGDEISPDTCRFWDTATGEKLDKDRFRRDLGGVEEAYLEVLRRVREAVTAPR